MGGSHPGLDPGSNAKHISGADSDIWILKQVQNDTGACLLRAKDNLKDQTYFLYRVTESALQKTLFPIGHLTKVEVREEAKKRGLITAARRESQGICFVGNVGIREFLGQYVEAKPGDIIESETGKKLGEHDGAIFYTFGQRHNLGVGGGLPYYVVGKDMAKNEVYVSTNLNDENFWRDELKLTNTHWINDPPVAGKKYQVRLRHRAPLIDCVIASQAQHPLRSNRCCGSETTKQSRLDEQRDTSNEIRENLKSGSLLQPQLGELELDHDDVIVKLAKPERATAPGQSAVIYDGEIVLGGGIVTN